MEHITKPGVRYAATDDGTELPVVDITNPAFAVGVAPEGVPSLVEASLRSMEHWLRVPSLIRSFAIRRSALMGGTARHGGFLPGMTTYLHKLGPDNLGAYCTDLDRRAARMVVSVAIRLRLRAIARSIADSLASSLALRDSPVVHMVNLGGGAASDTLNALIIARAEQPELLEGRRVSIHVLDLDAAGPRFAGRCLSALLEPGAPLEGVAATLNHVSYDWTDPSALHRVLDELAVADAVVVGSSEGGLFEYGSDRDISANLAVLRDSTPNDFAMVGTLVRDEPVTRVMQKANPLGFILRELEPFSRLVHHEGWRIDQATSDNPIYHIVRLRKPESL